MMARIPRSREEVHSVPRRLDRDISLDPERVAYWYFRLNGFLQIENFVIHPGGRGSQRTDADLLGVRFPDRKEFLFDDEHPMQDDADRLRLVTNRTDVVIAEIKRNEICRLNGPWTDENQRNIDRILAAIGCLNENNIRTAATALYKTGAFIGDRVQIRLIAIGRATSGDLAKQYKQVTQVTWDQILSFIWKRFNTYRKQKTDVQQWDPIGRKLKSMADRTREPKLFVKEALRAWRDLRWRTLPKDGHAARELR
jgi:hypothetical protein